MTIKLYNFAKRRNSTKKPTTDGVEKEIFLKDSTSIVYPVITIDSCNFATAWEYNYAYIVEFNRYYFITHWQYNKGLWIATLDIDVLATYFENIENDTQFVTYSESVSSPYIIDERNKITSEFVNSAIFGTDIENENPFTTRLENGTYIVGVTNSDSNAIGSVSYYALTQTQFTNLRHLLLSNVSWTNFSFQDISEELLKVLLNPLQYIVSCKWYPFQYVGGALINELPYGWWTLNTPAYRINNMTTLKTVDFGNIGNHENTNDYAKYYNDSPYSTFILHSPPNSIDVLPNGKMVDVESVHAQYYIDLVTGIAKMFVVGRKNSGDDITLLEKSVNIAVDMSLAQMSVDYTAPITGITSGLSSAFRLDIGGYFNAIGKMASGMTPSLSTVGGTGNISAYYQPPWLEIVRNKTINLDPAVYGYPYMSNSTLNNLHGYCQIEKPKISANCYAEEYDRLESLLSTGFFIERE